MYAAARPSVKSAAVAAGLFGSLAASFSAADVQRPSVSSLSPLVIVSRLNAKYKEPGEGKDLMREQLHYCS
ncbi:hypothetical protein PsYK624_051270 [Phanerochaete sordida]|uniref:Uncharacterized protein n=1 Tax=Phanerochaete sordida TaxID=48140 RepID=A0A9P3LCM8_9APHY|nr:hypothetical protein PsYK624_051270 [Phanerochaete sordida]